MGDPRKSNTTDVGTIGIVTICPPFRLLHGDILPEAIEIEDIESVNSPNAAVCARHVCIADETNDVSGKAESGNQVGDGKLDRPLRHTPWIAP